MRKERSVETKEKKDTNRQMIMISALVMALLFAADLYVMINSPQNFLVLAVITILLLVWLYLLITNILEVFDKNRKASEEQYENTLRAEKANYLLQKKIMEQLETIGKDAVAPAQEIIAAQKALTKMTISRNKENTDALMNSNEKVIEKMFQLQERMEKNDEQVSNHQKELEEESKREIVSELKKMEDSIKDELLASVDSMQDFVKETVTSVQEDMRGQLGTGIPESAETSFPEELPLTDEEPEVGEMPVFDDTLLTDDDMPLMEETPLAEEEPELGEMPLFDDIFQAEETPLAEEQPLMEELPLMEETPLTEEEPEIGEMPIFEDASVVEEVPVSEDESVIREIPLAEAEREAEEEKSKEPDLSNPNKIMTPEEIAALIASM